MHSQSLDCLNNQRLLSLQKNSRAFWNFSIKQIR